MRKKNLPACFVVQCCTVVRQVVILDFVKSVSNPELPPSLSKHTRQHFQ